VADGTLAMMEETIDDCLLRSSVQVFFTGTGGCRLAILDCETQSQEGRVRFAVNRLRELRLITNEMVGWFFKFVGDFCIWQLLISQYPGSDCPCSAVARDYLMSGDHVKAAPFCGLSTRSQNGSSLVYFKVTTDINGG
jgi:hypothetical protein